MYFSQTRFANNFFSTRQKKITHASNFFIAFLVILIFLISMLATFPITNSIMNNYTNISQTSVINGGNSVSVTNPSTSERLKVIHSADLNGNLIADGLDSILAHSKPNNQISVILILKENTPIPQSLLNQFKSLGGKVTYQWNKLGMFAGVMSAGAIHTLAKTNLLANSPLGLIQNEKQFVKESINNELTNIDPYVWQNYSLLGDRNNSIAILDTGIDATHPMLANYSSTPVFNNNSVKVVGWFDATTDNATTPQDYDGHGTHVAAIAAGNPYNDTNPNGNLNTTYVFTYNDTQSLGANAYAASEYLNITSVGTITQTYYWIRHGGSTATSGAGLRLVTPLGLTLYGTSISSNSTSGTYRISYSVTSSLQFGFYQLELVFYYQDPNSSLDMVSYGNEPYTPVSSVLHTNFAGVAPHSKIVGVKVFDNEGNGLSSYLINGINWIINHKTTYHITIASMSLGDPCSPTGCTSSDIDAGVEIAVMNLVNVGIVTFAAASNAGQSSGDQIGTPGDVDSVITVGATNNFHSLTSYSSMGPGYNSQSIKPDLTAPGGAQNEGGVLSADTNYNDAEGTMGGIVKDFQKNDMTSMQGTSMATPYAAGIGSLIIQAMGGYNNWNYTTNNVYKVKQIMLMSTWATYGSDRGTKSKYEGWGEIQADAAIDVIMKNPYVVGTTQTGSISNAVMGHKIWGRQVHLSAGTRYTFNLTMDSSLEADLYLYSNNYDTFGNPILLQISKNTGLGVPDSITFTAPSSGNYYLYIKTWKGYGSFSLSSTSKYIPTTITNLVSSSYSFKAGSGNQTLSWKITGTALVNYTIYNSNTQVQYNTLNSTSNIVSFNITNLATGSYDFTIKVYDLTNKLVKNSIQVTVQPKNIKTSPGFEALTLGILSIIPFFRKKKIHR